MRYWFFFVVLLVCSFKAYPHNSEVLYGLTLENDSLSVKVQSQGCTSKDSFKLVHNEAILSIERVKSDHCRRLPHLIWVSFSIKENIKPFKIKNSFALPNAFNRK